MSEQISSKLTQANYAATSRQDGHALLQLSTPEQFLISALRLWNQGRQDHGQCCCRSLLRNGFEAAGLLATEFEIFDRIITLIDAAQSDTPWIEHPHHHTLTHHEARYLRVLANCQRGDVTEALHSLRSWFAPSAARIVVADLFAFARSCAAVGLVLPRRSTYADHVTPPERHVIPLRSISARLH